MQNTIAIIPARGGSKRIPKKNIKDFYGKPMLRYAIDACKDAGIFTELMVSTDSDEVANIARNNGACVPFMRSQKTANDFSTTFDVLEEVIANYKKNGREFDYICCVYPCVPFLSGQTLKDAYNRLIISENNALQPVCKFPVPIEWAMKIEDGLLIPNDRRAQLIRSQDLSPKFFDVGMFYIIKTNALLGEKTLTPEKTMAYIMNEGEIQDIDTMNDWAMAELKYELIARQKMGKSQELYIKAKKIIPGGTQLLSKRPEQFLPDYWPAYYKKAKGCRVWDLDDKEYIDVSYMGIGANTIGYADDDIDCAVKNVIDTGNMTTLNPPEEVELAEKLIELHPWAQMVRFTRSGGEAMMVAVRIARAATGKDIILFCGYHGWHDWYIAANLSSDSALDGQLLPGLKPAGVPRYLKDSSFPFSFNNKIEFQNLINEYKGKVAAIVMEPIRNLEPEEGFWECIQSEAEKNKIPLIIDEITAGWRLNLGGAHLLYKIKPDIAVFAKGMSNGYPMAAIIGKKQYMDAAQDSFISSTYWTERIGPAAALATIQKMETHKVQEHFIKTGKTVQNGWNIIAQKTKLSIHVGSIYPLSHFDFQEQEPLVLKTLFTQEMLSRGYLATNSFYCSLAHTEDIVQQYLNIVEEVFSIIKQSILDNTSRKLLNGPVCQSGFKRLN